MALQRPRRANHPSGRPKTFATAGRLVLGLTLSLMLSGCNWFYQSTFPSYVPLIQNQVDVSDRFPSDPAGEFRVEIMNGGFGDHVVILAAGPNLGERLAIYDGDLKEQFYRKDSATADEFDRGSPVVIDNVPNLYVGNLAFGPGLSGPTLTGNLLTSEATLYASLAPTYYSFGTDGTNTLTWVQANPIDNPILGGTPPDVTTDPGAEVNRVATAMDIEADVAGIVGYDVLNNVVAGMVTSSTGFAPPVTLATASGGFQFSVDDGFVDRLSVTADGVVVEQEEDDRLLVFYDLDGKRGDSLDVSPRGDSAYAFSAAGSHFYLLNAEQGKLIRAKTWW